jgi:hypothetical protein
MRVRKKYIITLQEARKLMGKDAAQLSDQQVLELIRQITVLGEYIKSLAKVRKTDMVK